SWRGGSPGCRPWRGRATPARCSGCWPGCTGCA
ncbi:MAG: hypothetical protein AVDCRST_MAG66-1505, partial [uncultured Pseudonocardia sp.]